MLALLTEHVRKLWNNWELRALVLVSLTWQLCLLHFGSRRRYSVKTWLRVFLWLLYLGADSVATVTLGVISHHQGNCNDSQLQNELIAFWAPFLLLHLGGQDTITAYAIQDNELWLRHLLGLVVQSGVALYIFLLSWKVSWLSFLTIPMFLAGFIKYAERTWVLRSANYDPMATTIEGNEIPKEIFYTDEIHEILWLQDARRLSLPAWVKTGAEKDAFQFFEIFRCRFQNQEINILKLLGGNYSYFPNSQTAWKTIEEELGYAYDVFYTKAPFFFTAWGFLFRLFSFTSIVLVFLLFLIKERHKHPQIDLIITYFLLVGAVLIEIYAVILLCASDWPLRASDWPRYTRWLIKHVTSIRNRCAKLTSKQRWSNSMGQLNLLGLCLKDKSLQDGRGTPKLFANLREWALNLMLPRLNGEQEKLFFRTNKRVSAELKELVFRKLEERLYSNSNWFSEEYDRYINGGIKNFETYQSIIIWHIATDLCFYTDSGTSKPNLSQEVSKDVSNYMMYILAMCPSALSTGSPKHCFENTCILVKEYFQSRELSRLSKAQVCSMLLTTEYSELRCEKLKSLSENFLFASAVDLAKNLNLKYGKWEILSKFWVENLAYVATLCQGNNHAQLLRNGGEFLTHVWRMIEHIDLSRKF